MQIKQDIRDSTLRFAHLKPILVGDLLCVGSRWRPAVSVVLCVCAAGDASAVVAGAMLLAKSMENEG